MSARVEELADRLIVYNGNQARRGALTPELYAAIVDAVQRASAGHIRAVILTADGPFFCAGGDLNALREGPNRTTAERHERIESLHDVIRAIRQCPVPVICAVEGGAAGAGLSIALSADLIVAAEDALFTAAYVKAGLTPDGGLTHSLAALIPRALSMEMCLLGRAVSASRLATTGVINQIVANGKRLAVAQELADLICAGAPNAQRTIRTLVADAYDTDFESQLSAEREAMVEASGSAEATEGISAFFEKRKPNYLPDL